MNAVFEPGKINGLRVRNRVIKTATYEGMSPGSVPSIRLTEHHAELARGGVGMTTVAYCAVSPEGRTFTEQMWMSPETKQALTTLTSAVHDAGSAVAIQLGHCGGFSKDKSHGKGPLGPIRTFNPYGVMVGLPFTRAMTEDDIERTTEDFARAALDAKDAGFDAVEVHLGHGYLLSQWLSPVTNKRRDRHGGSLKARLIFPLMVIEAVRAAVGPDFPVLAKINVSDGVKGGLEIGDAVVVSKAIEGAGVDAIVTSGGFVSRNAFFLLRGARPLRHMIAVEKNWAQKIAMAVFGPFLVPKVPFEEMFFFDSAKRIVDAVDIPVVLLGGVVSRENLERAMSAGFEFVAMGRALIADPDLVNRMQAGTVDRTRCDHCNRCMTEMDRVGVRCILDDQAKLTV